MKRALRYGELIEEAEQVGLFKVPISLLRGDEEMAELEALKAVLDATARGQDQPRTAIVQGIMAGRYRTLRFPAPRT
jgi:hypothetical protein